MPLGNHFCNIDREEGNIKRQTLQTAKKRAGCGDESVHRRNRRVRRRSEESLTMAKYLAENYIINIGGKLAEIEKRHMAAHGVSRRKINRK